MCKEKNKSKIIVKGSTFSNGGKASAGWQETFCVTNLLFFLVDIFTTNEREEEAMV